MRHTTIRNSSREWWTTSVYWCRRQIANDDRRRRESRWNVPTNPRRLSTSIFGTRAVWLAWVTSFLFDAGSTSTIFNTSDDVFLLQPLEYTLYLKSHFSLFLFSSAFAFDGSLLQIGQGSLLRPVLFKRMYSWLFWVSYLPRDDHFVAPVGFAMLLVTSPRFSLVLTMASTGQGRSDG